MLKSIDNKENSEDKSNKEEGESGSENSHVRGQKILKKQLDYI